MCFAMRACGAMAVLLALHGAQAEDAHDSMVYQRYSRDLQPGKIKYPKDVGEFKHKELDRPATKKDFQEGRAVFTFEGLGPSRVWRLPKCPIFSHWPDLKRHLGSRADEKDIVCYGEVCQAEELQVGGKWKRYFGFMSRYGAAVVPAREIELSLSYGGQGVHWDEMGGGVDWGLRLPGAARDESDEKRLHPGEPLVIEVYLGNRLGDRQAVPTLLYRDAKSGGPAFRKGVELYLDYAPYDPRNPRNNYPEEKDYKRLKPVDRASFATDGAKRELATGESFKAFSFDLNDWFKLERPGYYQLHFEFDDRLLGLTSTPSRSGGMYYTINLGTEPRRLTVEELNREVEPLGGKANRERILRLIDEGVAPKADAPADVPSEKEGRWAWSSPVNGLAARIDFLSQNSYAGLVVLVRLKNASNRTFIVPVGNPRDSSQPRNFELHAKCGDEPWKRTTWFPGERVEGMEPKPAPAGVRYGADATGNRGDRPPQKLGPGESCLAFLCGGEGNNDVRRAWQAKIVLRQPQSAAEDHWHGVLETPPCLVRGAGENWEKTRGVLPAPTYLPELSRKRFVGGNMSGDETNVERLRVANSALVAAMQLYQPAGLLQQLERRMLEEKEADMKLLLAALAAPAGSRVAARYLLEMLNETDYQTLKEVGAALREVSARYRHDPPEWLVELILAVLSDKRYAKGLEKTNISSPARHRLWEVVADRLTDALGEWKCRKAVPVLLDLVNSDPEDIHAPGLTFVLGDIGDARAVPALMAMLQRRASADDPEGALMSDSDEAAVWVLVKLRAKEAIPLMLKLFEHNKKFTGLEGADQLSEHGAGLLSALAELDAKEAVPLMLEHVEHPSVIQSLVKMKERKAIPALREIVAAKGKMIRNGVAIRPESEHERLFAARLGLALFEQDSIPGLCELLADQTLRELDRGSIVGILGQRRDDRAVPHLLKAIKTDPNGAVVDDAIRALSVFKSRETVAGLIDCFDADFERTDAGKRKRVLSPKENIARSLRAITGQTFGPDAQQWRKWWEETGKQSNEWK